jgi:hypothetical protein
MNINKIWKTWTHQQVGTQTLNLELIMMEILVVSPKHHKCYEKIPQTCTIHYKKS